MRRTSNRAEERLARSKRWWRGAGEAALATAGALTAVGWGLRLFVPMLREVAAWAALSAPDSARVISLLLAGR